MPDRAIAGRRRALARRPVVAFAAPAAAAGARAEAATRRWTSAMSADRPPPVEELVRRGRDERQRRQAEATATADERRRAEEVWRARRDRRAAALLTWPIWRGLSWGSNLIAAGVLGLLASGMVLPIAATVVADDRTLVLWWFAGTLAALASGTAIVLRARRRDIAFRRSLPFPVIGYPESLDVGRSYPRVRFRLCFAGQNPPAGSLHDALGVLQEPTAVESVAESAVVVVVNARSGSKFDGHRRWLPPWFRALCRECLIPLH